MLHSYIKFLYTLNVRIISCTGYKEQSHLSSGEDIHMMSCLLVCECHAAPAPRP